MSKISKLTVVKSTRRNLYQDIDEMHGRLEGVIMDYAGVVPIVSAVGILELLKQDLLDQAAE